jgi:dolichol-phosphate mannosyltransferase
MIPTYDERDNLEPIVARVRAAQPDADILVVDDDSPDGTGALADQLAAADAHVHVLHRPGKQGLGRAYIDAMRWGVRHDYDVLVELDADGSHQPEQLGRLLERMADFDLVLGSRWVPGGRVENWPWHRMLISRLGSAYARLALGLGQRDVTGGYRAFRASALARIDLDAVHSHGYAFQVDLLYRAARAGLRITEVPITFVERERGQSKMSPQIVAEAMWRVTVWGLSRRRPIRTRRRTES